MNGGEAIDDAVFGRIDAEGRLVRADPRLAALHEEAGGAPGGALAVPQIAALARLARRLGIPVSRRAIAAEGEHDLDLWVRARPDADGVDLAVSGWTPRRSPAPADDARRDQDFLRAEADWLWETDERLRLTSISPAAEIEAGALARLVGQPLTGLFRFTNGDGGELPILDALAGRRRFSGQIAEIRGSEGARVTLSGVPLTDGRGRFAGFRGAAVVLPSIAPAGPALADVPFSAMPDAFGVQLDRALRGPLDRIVAHAESIRAQIEGPIRRDYAEYAGDIASAGRHLLALVDDLIDLQAIERDDFAPRAEPLDLAELSRAAAGLLAVRAADRRISIDSPASDETLLATGEYKRVLQILVNLIGNAVSYSPEGSMVWIRCEREDDLVAVIVADQGAGIASDDQARIFEKFERLENREPGTGLGLYIARRLARAMGGDIAVDSAPGQGARFVLTLPATASG